MKTVFIIVLCSLMSLPVCAGNEFWAWQEKHKQQLSIEQLDISPSDSNYIEQISDSWEPQTLYFDEYVPFDTTVAFPKKKVIEADIFESASAMQFVAPAVEILETPHLLNERIAFQFYQHDLILKDSAKWSIDNVVQSKDDVAKSWAYFSTLPSTGILEQFWMLKQELNLNDWDFSVLLFQYSGLWQTDVNAQWLQTQFLLVQSGMNVTLGFSKERLFLLMQTQQLVLNESYMIDKKQKRWYILDLNNNIDKVEKLQRVGVTHTNSREPFNLLMNPKLNLGGQWQSKLFNYQIQNTQYDIYLPFQSELIKHYNNYPILALEHYVNQEIHEFVFNAIYQQIKDKLNTKQEQETINFLLEFVQTLIKSDKNNGQPSMLIQQVVFESQGDSPERVLLFSNLIENIMGNYMMIIEYKNHISTGIKLESENNLNSFHVNLNDYVFADPSYAGGQLGDKMPLKNNPFKKWLPLY